MLTLNLSILLYVFVIVVGTLFAYYITIAEDIIQKLLLGFLIIFLAFFPAARNINVSFDTSTYIYYFECLLSENYEAIYINEKGFLFISKILLYLFKTPQALMFFYSALTVFLFVIGLWKLRGYSNFAVSIFVFLTIGSYFSIFNLLRQCLALGFIIFGLKDLFNKKYFKYIVFCLIGFIFHITAILSLINLVIFYIIANKDSLAKKTMFLTLVAVLGCISGIYVFQKYSFYLDRGYQFNFSIILLIKLIFAFQMLYIYKFNCKDERDLIFESSICVYTIGIFLSMLGTVFLHAERIGAYCMIIEPIFIGMIYKKSKLKNYTSEYLLLSVVLFIKFLSIIETEKMIYGVFWC